LGDRALGHVDRAHETSEGEGRTQNSEPVRANIQDGGGIDRQEGDGTTEQNRKQVESDRAENHLPGRDEFEAGQDVADADRHLTDDLHRRADHGGQNGGEHEHRDGENIDKELVLTARGAEGNQQTGDGRADDSRHLETGG